MPEDMPSIAAVSAETDTALRVAWEGGSADVIELAGWISGASLALEPLKDPAVFRAPRLAAYGAAVAWGEPDGDLAIDSWHLWRRARGTITE